MVGWIVTESRSAFSRMVPGFIALGGTLLVFGSLAFSSELFDTVAVSFVAFAIIMWITMGVSRPEERRWLPKLVIAGFAAKIVGAIARFYVVTEVYGTGDAIGYHGFGRNVAPIWRALEIPNVYGPDVRRGAGTVFAKYATSFIYAPHVPTLLGGFITFAALALIGQIGFYVAFRRWFPDVKQRKIYAAMIFFTPTIVFWSASVGKDALMILFLGVAAAGISWFLATYQVRAGALAMLGLFPAFRLRPHITLMMVGGTVLAAFLARRAVDKKAQSRRIVLMGAALLTLAWAIPQAADALKIDLTSEGLDSFIESQERNTQKGGSAVDGTAVRGLGDLPSAILRVLFRPLPNEAGSLQLQLAAAESVLLIGLLLWRAPTILRSFGRLKRNPWVIVCLGHLLLFIVAFSTVLNLGIIARQRVQVYPFLMALVAALGWRAAQSQEPATAMPAGPVRTAPAAFAGSPHGAPDGS